MHRLATLPGGWNPSADGVIFVEQQPAPIVVITAADTDIQTLAVAAAHLPAGFPSLRVVNLLQLQQQLTIDTYAEDILANAAVIIVRLIGGQSYWSYGLDVVEQTAKETGAALIFIPGDERPDPTLTSHSTVSLALVNQVWQYFIEAGSENYQNLLRFVAAEFLQQAIDYKPPQSVPRVGLYRPSGTSLAEVTVHTDCGFNESPLRGTSPRSPAAWGPNSPKPPEQEGCGEKQVWLEGNLLNAEVSGETALEQPVAVLSHEKDGKKSRGVAIVFYRAHYLAGNTAAIDALCEALIRRDLTPVPIFVSSLKEPDVQTELRRYCSRNVDVLLNTTSFSLASLETDTPKVDLWQMLNVPVFQVIFSGGTREAWEAGIQGLTPRDMAMNVALPEVDGRIITRAVSFKTVQTQNALLQTDVVVYEPERSRIEFVAALASNWVKLCQASIAERKIALILANYPNRDGRLANGVGLDTPASCLEILKALQSAGYTISELPETSDDLMQLLAAGITNDPESLDLRSVNQALPLKDYQAHFQTLPLPVQTGIQNRWGKPLETDAFPIAGIQFGNVFVGIQPARGYDRDPTLNYHAPDLEPTHSYLAFYHWVNAHFGANAVVHVGKHGNLEWLPGKSVALSENCYPEAVFGAMPHFYPFIVNDPGEGSQAKRRSQAVILDHLTPPMTRAELYGSLHQLEGLIDEYYEAQTLDPARVSLIRDRLMQLIQQENLHKDLGIETELSDEAITKVLTAADGYLCELKEAQIRDGLHIFGQCPDGRQLRDLIVAIARNPNANRLGLTRAIAQDWQLDFDPLTATLGDVLEPTQHPALQTCRIIGDAVEVIETYAATLVEALLTHPTALATNAKPPSIAPVSLPKTSYLGVVGDRGEVAWREPETELTVPAYDLCPQHTIGQQTQQELLWVRDRLLPALRQTDQEIINLLRGLNGHYIPSGASGAPTRGRPEVLPTGRNFYSVDIRAIPTETAWDIGRKAAETLIERYTQEHGEYPKTLGLSIWGTSTMRTGGDDLAEALALLGVQPVWDGVSRRVIDFEILPLSFLGRPRVDVTLRISGFFRDAFPNLIDLFDSAVNAVANLDEPADQNPLAAQVQQETLRWEAEGLMAEQAAARSRYRIFGSKPSAYGAGLQGLIEAQNWESDDDLARAYINWSAYAYTRNAEGKSAPEAFTQRLGTMQIVLQNQDNREHDLLDSDDYYQFQGGLTAAVRSVSKTSPEIYFGDHSRTAQPKVRKLSEEIARVYRSRVVNPKWIAGAMRHGYKGAFEMAATLDYLFAYDATTHCVEDFMYEGVAEAYVFDPAVQNFIQKSNPWALRDMAERLLEANQRGLWSQPDPKMLDRLKAIANEAEGTIEAQYPETQHSAIHLT
ncbi:cobaltochelatase subunit CobN [Leptolyngbya sp. FACHB-321]|uniref:cobaltochelatase subunit CobN n=1 Tax=Leptolyngbya sp. FACHB-321 TaxID=2692807 RepID=UPI00168711BA|nr:cobaltochelatase subunit CobN [Leptolyngbya sp. FACHB-321]MBD2035134.1 cobaltochelatase subunit CobN [Leptolyngbya sp. FACHB-321]